MIGFHAQPVDDRAGHGGNEDVQGLQRVTIPHDILFEVLFEFGNPFFALRDLHVEFRHAHEEWAEAFLPPAFAEGGPTHDPQHFGRAGPLGGEFGHVGVEVFVVVIAGGLGVGFDGHAGRAEAGHLADAAVEDDDLLPGAAAVFEFEGFEGLFEGAGAVHAHGHGHARGDAREVPGCAEVEAVAHA